MPASVPPGAHPSSPPPRPRISDRVTQRIRTGADDRRPSEIAAEAGGDGMLAVVQVASWDLGALRALGLRLHGRASVVPVRDVRALTRVSSTTLVVLDAQAPELDLHDAAETLLASRATVVVWGASRALRDTLSKTHGTRGWVHVPAETSARELAELVSTMLA